MRTKHLLPLLVLLLTTLSTHAYDFKSGDLYYNITSDTTVEVTYNKKKGWSIWSILRTPKNNKGISTAIIPTTVTYKSKTYSVTSIGYAAFAWCSALTSITIPNSVTSTGRYAFYGCSALTSMVVESGNTMYDSRDNCNAIIETATNTLIAGCQSTTIPNSVTSIGEYAFYHCSSLTSITIPNSVTSIGEGAFAWCSALTSITIPESVTSIGIGAFYNCYSLTSITIPNSVTTIEDGVFGRCSALTSLTIPNSVTSIGWHAFEDCSSLTSITIPNSVTTIEDGAFYNCYALTSITIPNSVTSIGKAAFHLIPHIVYKGKDKGAPWGARSVNGYEEGFLVYADETKSTLLACSAAATGEITIPNSVKKIGREAFIHCSSLTSLTIPNSVKRIGKDAFYSVANIVYMGKDNGPSRGARSVNGYVEGNLVYANEKKKKLLACNKAATGELTIPNSVTSIGEWAFEGCSSLTSVTIPKSVREIGSFAFNGCSGVVDVYCYATIPPDGFSSSAFSGVSKNCNLHVPKGSIHLYRTPGKWDRSYIFEIAEE